MKTTRTFDYLQTQEYDVSYLSNMPFKKGNTIRKGVKLSQEQIDKTRAKLIGKKHTLQHKLNIGKSIKGRFKEEKNPLWKGNKASYQSIHQWVRRHKGKANKCSNNPTHINRTYHWSNISGLYKRDLNDYRELCVSCHHAIDGIQYKAWATRRKENN